MKIKICIGESCHLQGAEEVVKTFQENIAKNIETASADAAVGDKVQLMGCFCMNNCHENQVSVSIDTVKHSIHPHDAAAFFKTQLKIEE